MSERAHRATAGFSAEKSARAIAAGNLLIQAAQAINSEVASKRHGIALPGFASNQSWWHNCQMILISHGKHLRLPVMLVSWQLDERFAGSMLCQKMDKFGAASVIRPLQGAAPSKRIQQESSFAWLSDPSAKLPGTDNMSGVDGAI